MADHSLQRTEVFLKNQHVSFIGPYRPTSIYTKVKKFLYALVGYFILILKGFTIATATNSKETRSEILALVSTKDTGRDSYLMKAESLLLASNAL